MHHLTTVQNHKTKDAKQLAYKQDLSITERYVINALQWEHAHVSLIQ